MKQEKSSSLNLKKLTNLTFDDGIPPEEKERAQSQKVTSPDGQEFERLLFGESAQGMEKLKAVKERRN